MPSSRKREELGRELGVAATNGRVSAVQHLLAAGADKEVPTPLMGMMMTPLTAAAYTNNERIVRALIQAGASVDGGSNTGHTPLHCCAMEGQEGMMKELLDAGANPTLTTVEGNTALHTAAQWGNAREPVLKMLISAGAEIDARCTKGYTPLKLAAWKGTVEAVKTLLEAGADVLANDYTGHNILSGAYHNNNDAKIDKIIQLLLDAGADPDTTDPDGQHPPLLLAVHANKPKMIRSLIAAGANPNITSTQGLTPIGLAVNMGFDRCLAVLLRSGGSPHANNSTGPTLLQSAILELYPTCLAFLLQAGANPEKILTGSSPYPAKLRKRLTTNYKLDTPEGRCRQILLVAQAYNARSWQWPASAIATSANPVEQKEEDRAGKEVVGTKPPRSAASWMKPRRGVFVPAVLWFVTKTEMG
ncbi:unnamed protein product [Ectocarpus sp. CCAP 1310/34]|nr:unnamed protein product [Ectocarpus sp. CCAP 1310/34]